MSDLGIGIVGCGNISDTYAELIPGFRGIRLVACADIDPARAAAKAAGWGVRSSSVEELLGDPAIDIVVNLTVPAAHAQISAKALGSGKHVWTEKPLSTRFDDAHALVQLADASGLRLGSAPDTFLGGAHQQARSLLDTGLIGRPVAGCAAVLSHGMESWHPDPDFFFQPGGGPMLDLGPYYITSLINLLGPVRQVASMANAPERYRTIGSGARRGQQIPVDTPTNIHAILEFHQGALVTLSTSWDVWANKRHPIEIYGSEGSLFLPDPNDFDGTVELSGNSREIKPVPPTNHPFGRANKTHPSHGPYANYRGAGLADMAAAIREGRPHRASHERALHALEVMLACLQSAESGQFIPITSTCTRAEPLHANLARELQK